jgi:Uma2 family endonuclease
MSTQIGDVRARQWTRDEFYRLLELGFFRNQRVELIEGEVLEIAPPRRLHLVVICLLQSALEPAFGKGYWVRALGSLDLSHLSVPDPDIAVVEGAPFGAGSEVCSVPLMIAEVSDVGLDYDRWRKGSLYARAGIPDYWVVNLVDRQIEVYRRPVPDPRQPYGFCYIDRQIYLPELLVTPLAAPRARLRVSEMMP